MMECDVYIYGDIPDNYEPPNDLELPKTIQKELLDQAFQKLTNLTNEHPLENLENLLKEHIPLNNYLCWSSSLTFKQMLHMSPFIIGICGIVPWNESISSSR